MGKISLNEHWKFRQLARAVGSRVIAIGLLEALWFPAYAVADPFIGNADDIADALEWPRIARLIGHEPDPLALVTLLKSCGFLDEPEPGMYLVHDLWDHAPMYVRLRWIREHPNKIGPWQERQADACDHNIDSPSLTRQGRAGQKIRTAARVRRGPVTSPVTEAPKATVLAALGHELHGQTFESSADAKEALKALAAKKRIPYDSGSLAQALDLMARGDRPLVVTADPRTRSRAGPTRRA